MAVRHDDHQRSWYHRKMPISESEARARLTAYVYGNVLVLSALVPFQEREVTWTVISVVIGTALSTFIAHLFAHSLGGGDQHGLLKLARESVPILTSGSVPVVILLAAYFGLIPSAWAIIAAEILLLGRIAATGMLVARLRDEPSQLRILLSGVAVAVLGALVVLIKALLPH